ncbi:hypothetical protein JMJ78_0000972 [Colletotrichum scovillei]|nr:hypothetical protein JMJ78_0000972 [Colletotrichum scovillei]
MTGLRSKSLFTAILVDKIKVLFEEIAVRLTFIFAFSKKVIGGLRFRKAGTGELDEGQVRFQNKPPWWELKEPPPAGLIPSLRQRNVYIVSQLCNGLFFVCRSRLLGITSKTLLLTAMNEGTRNLAWCRM